MTWGDNGPSRPTTEAYRNNNFWDRKKMNIKLQDLNIGQLLDIEKCIYNSDYEFTDDQFRAFVDNQVEFGLDPIELELQDEVVYIYEQVYFFEDLIDKGDYIER